MEQGYKRCYGCMNLVANGQYCNCGFDLNSYSMAAYWKQPGYFFDDRYELGKVIGEGGFGVTYIGFDHRTNKKVAIKQLKQVLSKEQRESILRLISLGKVESLVQVFDLTRVDDTWYIVMEYVEGINGVQYLSQLSSTLNSQQVSSLLLPIVHTVDVLHQKGILHRDICTDNIMISYDLNVTLIDIDTVYIMSNNYVQDNNYNVKSGFTPIEQYQSGSIPGPWVDIYSMCATIYHFLTGFAPVDAKRRIRNGEVLKTFESLKLDVDPRLSRSVYSGLELNASDRNITFNVLASNLQEVGKHMISVSNVEVNEPVDFEVNGPYVAEDEFKTYDGRGNGLADSNIASISPDLVENTEGTDKKSKSKKKRVLIALVSILALIIILSGSIGVYIVINREADDKKEESSAEEKAKEDKYEEALELLESEDETEQLKGVAILKELGDFEDSYEKLYEMAAKYSNNGNYTNAIDIYKYLDDFEESRKNLYNIGLKYTGSTSELPIAIEVFEYLSDRDYEDSADKLFDIADYYLSERDYDSAKDVFDYLKDAGKSSEDGLTGEEGSNKCEFYRTYLEEFSNGKYEKAKRNFEALGDYYCDEYSISAQEMVDKCREELAKEDVESKDFDKYPEAEEVLKEIKAYDSLLVMASNYVEAKKYSDAMEIYKYLDENTSNSYTNEIRNCEVGSKEEAKYKEYNKAASSSYDQYSDTMVSYVDADAVESALSRSYGEYKAEDGSIYNISVYELNGALYGIKSIQINSNENPYYVAKLYNLSDTAAEINITFNVNEEMQKTDEYGSTYSVNVNTINVDGKVYYESSYFE